MSKYVIPNDIKTEMRMYKQIYMFDFIISVVMIGVTYVLGRFVEPSFKFPFYLFMTVVVITLLSRPRTNPKKRMYQAMILALNRSRQTYQSVDEPRRKES